MAYHFADLVHTQSFTPKEPQVELLEAAWQKNILSVIGGHSKSFICCKLIEHVICQINGNKFVIYAGKPGTVHFAETLRRLASSNVYEMKTRDEIPSNAQIIVTSADLLYHLLSDNVLSIERISLIIIDGCESGFVCNRLQFCMQAYATSTDRPKILALAGSIIEAVDIPWKLDADLSDLESIFHCTADVSNEVVTALKYSVRPVEVLLEYNGDKTFRLERVTDHVRDIVIDLQNFLQDHRYAPWEIYDKFVDDLCDCPEPQVQPIDMLSKFLDILLTLGPWAADKAAFALLLQVEFLKVKIAYERHFLLLNLVATTLVKIRAIFEDFFRDVTEEDRVLKYCTPKLLRLFEVLKEFGVFAPTCDELVTEPSDNCRCHIISQFLRRRAVESALKLEEVIHSEQPASKAPWNRRKGAETVTRPQELDPRALCGLILVKDELYAKVIFQILSDLKKFDDFAFIRVCYTVEPSDMLENCQVLERAHRKQEVVLKRFRMRECNLLVGTSFLEYGIDLPKCNLVVRFDLPLNFRSYEHGKCRARGQDSLHCVLVPNSDREADAAKIAHFHIIEKLLVRRSNGFDRLQAEDAQAELYTRLIKPFCPMLTPQSPLVLLSTAISLVNRYCAKLPSDTFTRLTPVCIDRVLKLPDKELYICIIRLPINSPLKQDIVGPAMPTIVLARRFAALQCCLKLHEARELDDNLLPISKESFWLREEEQLGNVLDLPEELPLKSAVEIRPGTTKRRQYYNKRIATCLTDCRPVPLVKCYLYYIKMTLTCPLPEEQNTRGRPIQDPEGFPRGFGLLTGKPIPNVGAFPIFTRAGEVEVALQLSSSSVLLKEEDIKKIMTFINYTFTSVLRLQKYLMMFDPDTSENAYFIVPTIKESGFPNSVDVDWDFLDKIYREALKIDRIVEESIGGFQFDPMRYTDAVVSPWYRNQDQPQYFYVAEICSQLNPKSAFPGNDYTTFENYYFSKYGIQVQDLEQALLDVDHTSARLNFLTPRYVNRKGVALPTTSEEKKRAKRENLAQKQILVPELCLVHPFPASLWQKAVCLPCILHRLNALLLADELRRLVAEDLNLGDSGDPKVEWGPLDFGWKLADVLAKSKETREEVPVQLETLVAIEKSDESSSEEIDDFWKAVGTWRDEVVEPDSNLPYRANDKDSTSGITDDWEGQEWCNNPVDSDHIDVLSDISYSDSGLSDFSDDSSETDSDNGLKIQFMDKDVAEAVEPDFAIDLRQKEEVEEGWSGSESLDDDPKYAEYQRIFKKALDDEVNFINEKIVISHKEQFNLPWNIPQEHKSFNDFLGTLTANTTNSHSLELVDNFNDVSTELEHVQLIKQNLSKYNVQLDVKKNAKAKLKNCEQLGQNISCTADDDLNIFSSNRQPELDGHSGPSPSLILQALTMSNANDGINLERLETIGDSFLKYAITTYLYCTYENVHEGKLSHLRSKQVSNLNLYRLGRLKDFGESMVATKFEPHDNWLPPCYFVPRDLERALIEEGVPAGNWNRADLPSLYGLDRDEVTKIVRRLGEQLGLLGGDKSQELNHSDSVTGFIPYNLMTQHSIPDKSIADCVEALIGAYLVACGPRGALLFMSWLGIKVLPKDEVFGATREELLINRAVGHTAPRSTGEAGSRAFVQTRYGRLSKPSSPLIRNVPDPEGSLARLMTGFEKLEAILEYSFNDRSYLLQALTHASFSSNRLTDCYQRLEFLGDAVLDYLITRHLYDDPRHHSPGALTDLRSALVNNTIFASLAVRFDFHKFFRHLCPGLHDVLNRFVRIQELNGHVIQNECFLVEEEECETVEDVEVPKALGDIFESVAGAIFLDSGMKLDAVWGVYYRLMKVEIDAFSTNVPKSPIRELLELEPETAQFGKPEKLADGRRVRVTVEVFGKGSFKGIGRNYRIAKCTAAKCALMQLKRRGLLERKKS